MMGMQTWRPALQLWQRLLCLQGRAGRTRFENRHQKRLVYPSIQARPLLQHLPLVNFLRLFTRIPSTPIEIYIILLLIIITANALHTLLSLLEATLWCLLRLHLKSVIIATNLPIISTGWQEYIPPWRSSFRSVFCY